ncbi:TIGR04222 domain-containing membrane protein [Nonomuraea sp. NPDC003709]|uniref:TIGR04222 domain-containing membrane protein n=1 Tax=Nonomuraea sp. NPDC003709 TaxID=3154450 RepID=UPI0033AA7D82
MDLFLLILSVALAATALTTASAFKRERAVPTTSRTRAMGRKLSHYEIAYLAGGPEQVAGTAIALLTGSGDLRVARGGHVHNVHARSVSRDPVEQVVLATVADRSGLPASALKTEVRRSLAMDELKRHLTDAGLVLPGDRARRLDRLAAGLQVVSALAFAGVVADVVTVLTEGTKPLLAFSLIALAITGAGAAAVIANRRKSRRHKLTAHGVERLGNARKTHPLGSGGGRVHTALYGPGAQVKADLRAARAARRPRRRATYGGGYSGYSGSSGCSSSGGGGCGSSSSCGGASGCGGGGCGGGGS